MTVLHKVIPALVVFGMLGMIAHGEPASKTKTVAALAEETTPIEVGATLPQAKVQNLEGEILNLAELAADGPVVLAFYRGGWCPYCTTQLQALAQARPALEKLGLKLIAIAPDRPEKLQESVVEHELDYTLLSDAHAEAAKALGIAFKVDADTVERYKGYGIDLEAASGQDHHILPVPTVIIARKGGEVGYIFSEPDYKVRLSNEGLLAAAEALAQ